MELDYIYDLEVFPNFFSAAFEHAASDKKWYFELSCERNDLNDFVTFIYNLRDINARMIGYNNVGFDYPIVHMICTSLDQFNTPQTMIDSIFAKCHGIIHGDRSNGWAHMVWESDWIVEQIDLYKIHHFDNIARATSLKMLEFNMRSDNIHDLPFEPGFDIPRTGLPVIRYYNAHDVSETKKFYFKSLAEIKLREELTEKYGRNFMNDNDTKIGKQYFIMKLEESQPGCTYYRDAINKKWPRQTVRHSVDLASVIFGYITFEQPEFNRILDYFKAQTITEYKGVFKGLHCTVAEFDYHFGAGGIHGSVDSQTVESDVDFAIIDVDVASYYPNIAIVNQLYPEHLSANFCTIYKDVYDQRKGYAKGTPENKMFKLALNGVYGDSNNKFSPFYDSAYTMAITINGQLLLCMLAEQLIKIPQLTVIQINTDGVTVKVPRTLIESVNRVSDWWEKFTLLTLEHVEYNRMFVRDVNNYIGEYTDGKLKRKGAYEYELEWNKNHSALVVKKAAEAALVNGEDIAAFIYGHKNFMDFMLRAKVPRTSKLVGVDGSGLDQPLEKITRYYVTHTGVELVKIMPPLKKNPLHYRRIGIDVGWKVTPCNDLLNVTEPVNYEYYIEKANKLVSILR